MAEHLDDIRIGLTASDFAAVQKMAEEAEVGDTELVFVFDHETGLFTAWSGTVDGTLVATLTTGGDWT